MRLILSRASKGEIYQITGATALTTPSCHCHRALTPTAPHLTGSPASAPPHLTVKYGQAQGTGLVTQKLYISADYTTIHKRELREGQVVSWFRQVVIPHPWFRAICLNGCPIGFIAIEPEGTTGLVRGRALLSCALGRDYWNRGIATSAVRKAVANAFEEMPNVVRIQAFVDPDNKASQRVLQKSGFVKEGLLRKYVTLPNGQSLDLICYSILSSDPVSV